MPVASATADRDRCCHEDERVASCFASGIAWDAFARYAGNHVTDLEINDDATLDVSRAFRLACHEGYPGHHIQHLLIDRVYDERQWPELLLTPGLALTCCSSKGRPKSAPTSR